MRFIALLLTLTVAAGISAATQRATVPTAEKAPTFSETIAPIVYAELRDAAIGRAKPRRSR